MATLLAGQLAPEAFAEASIVLIGNWVNAEVAVLLRWEPAAEHLTFLTSAGLNDASITEIVPGIEDVFLELMKHEG